MNLPLKYRRRFVRRIWLPNAQCVRLKAANRRRRRGRPAGSGKGRDAGPVCRSGGGTPRKTAQQGAVTKMCDLKPDTRITIEGEVVYTEDKELKNGELIKHKFVLSDYTSSITCFFLRATI